MLDGPAAMDAAFVLVALNVTCVQTAAYIGEICCGRNLENLVEQGKVHQWFLGSSMKYRLPHVSRLER